MRSPSPSFSSPSQRVHLPCRSLREEDFTRSVYSILRNIIQREFLLVWIRELYPYCLHFCRENPFVIAVFNPYGVARTVQGYSFNVYVKYSHSVNNNSKRLCPLHSLGWCQVQCCHACSRRSIQQCRCRPKG